VSLSVKSKGFLIVPGPPWSMAHANIPPRHSRLANSAFSFSVKASSKDTLWNVRCAGF
jgi:hypothetical protein